MEVKRVLQNVKVRYGELPSSPSDWFLIPQERVTQFRRVFWSDELCEFGAYIWVSAIAGSSGLAAANNCSVGTQKESSRLYHCRGNGCVWLYGSHSIDPFPGKRLRKISWASVEPQRSKVNPIYMQSENIKLWSSSSMIWGMYVLSLYVCGSSPDSASWSAL